jgi:hypothetical protein
MSLSSDEQEFWNAYECIRAKDYGDSGSSKTESTCKAVPARYGSIEKMAPTTHSGQVGNAAAKFQPAPWPRIERRLLLNLIV